jgi:hypothetical protein
MMPDAGAAFSPKTREFSMARTLAILTTGGGMEGCAHRGQRSLEQKGDFQRLLLVVAA